MHKFDQFIQDALSSFPPKLRSAIGNAAIVVEPFPRACKTGEREIKRGTILLGLYEGVPQNRWGRSQSGVLPDKITLFQNNIESFAGTDAELKELVKDVLWHEIGHHFGFDEAQVRKIEARRKGEKH